MFETSSVDIDVTFEDVAKDEEPIEVAERATSLPGFDLARFASEAMLDGDWDTELDRPTVEITSQSLMALLSKSVPPTRIIRGETAR